MSSTIKDYRKTINRFGWFLASEPTFDNLNDETVERFMAWLYAKPSAVAPIGRMPHAADPVGPSPDEEAEFLAWQEWESLSPAKQQLLAGRALSPGLYHRYFVACESPIPDSVIRTIIEGKQPEHPATASAP